MNFIIIYNYEVIDEHVSINSKTSWNLRCNKILWCINLDVTWDKILNADSKLIDKRKFHDTKQYHFSFRLIFRRKITFAEKLVFKRWKKFNFI